MLFDISREVFLNRNNIGICGLDNSLLGGLSLPCRMLSDITGFHPLE